MDEEATATLPVESGKCFSEMSVGKNLLNYDSNYDSMVALTHFKGHAVAGFGGSNKNIGIGCDDSRVGKGIIHSFPGSEDLWSVIEEALAERMTESTKAIIDHFGKRVVYVNILRNMSVSCDCEGVEDEPVVTPNLGIVASLDILAADQASVDLVYAMKPEERHDLVERMESCHGLRQLSYMKELGMGNDRYLLTNIDNGDRLLSLQDTVKDLQPFTG